jgi:hypothetical protein
MSSLILLRTSRAAMRIQSVGTMAYLSLFLLLLLSNCATKQLPDVQQSAPVAFLNRDNSNHSSRLPPGPYYVSFRPDLNEIDYFSLASQKARYVGDAVIQVNDCSAGLFGEYMGVDQQGKIDVFLHCRGGSGFLQLRAGEVGNIHPLREIITQFPKTASVMGDVDSKGNVAVGYNADSSRHDSSSEILVYGPSASGRAQPLYKIPVFTRNCTNENGDKGPGTYPGSPAQISFDASGDLVTQIGPMSNEQCGWEFLERFAPGAVRYSSWLLPGLLPGNKFHRQTISVTPGAYAVAPDGEVTFGAYVGRIGEGRVGGISYRSSASGFRPLPSRIFTDAGGDLDAPRPAISIGVDHSGNIFVQNQRGGSVVAEFAPSGHGNVAPIRSWQLPQAAVGWFGTFVEILK